MKEFVVHVERIVRPIQAIDDRKDRMREELFAHLMEAFEQERAKGADDAVAQSRALASLGDPSQLRSELQCSVSRGGRLKAQFERIFSWHAPEPAWRYTLRVGVYAALSLFFMIPVTYAVLLPWGLKLPAEAIGIVSAVACMMGMNIFVLGVLYFRIRNCLLSAFGDRRSWTRIVGYVLASGAFIEGSLLFFLWSFTGELGEAWDLFLGRSLICFVLPIVGVIVAWVHGPAEIRHTNWECVDIGAG
jgi:hypothetical protein